MNTNYGRDLDLNLLRVFAVVAEEQNITRAAARLYVTQPAISAAIRRLTAFVGMDLVVRQGRGVALTKRGEELLVAARAHLQPLVAATMAVPTFDPKTSTATIRIGLVDGVEVVVFPKVLELLRSEAPRMQLVVVPVQFRTIESLLLSNQVDVALCVADELPRSIVREPLVSDREVPDGFCCLYDPRFAKLPARLTEREYFSREHVAVSYAGDTRGIVEDALGKSRTVRVAVPSLSLVADVLDGTALLGTVPTPLARHVVKTRPHLRYTPLPFALPGGSLDLLWLRAATDDKVVGYMRELLSRVVGDLVVGMRGRARRSAGSRKELSRRR
ncbi:MAG: LysR family transcriptional regulator [Labilithrix sp.]|nr:LysR family transcriptional regulator [Labilithrix sp.]